uniref:Carbohydrate sulfotransferase n=1 Tax=Gadus morhua TaxID=8049 RepID=A0A8C4ZY07_GADMO
YARLLFRYLILSLPLSFSQCLLLSPTPRSLRVLSVLQDSRTLSAWRMSGKQNRNLLKASEFSGLAVLHQSRRDQVLESCRAHSESSRKRRVLTPDDLKHLVVDEDHQLLYCYVPKVACTNWKRVMMVLTGRGNDPMEIPSNEAHLSANLKTLNQYSIADINHRLKHYLKFLFVREPFERLVSAYRNKFTLKYNSSFHKRFGTRIVRRYHPRTRSWTYHPGRPTATPSKRLAAGSGQR